MKISHNGRIRNRWDYLWKVLMCEQWKDSKQDLKKITKLMAQGQKAALMTKERKSNETRPSKYTSEPSAVSDDRWGRPSTGSTVPGPDMKCQWENFTDVKVQETATHTRLEFLCHPLPIQTVPVPAVKPKKFREGPHQTAREREDSPQINFPSSAHATKSYTSISHDPHNGLDESFCPLP